MGKGAGKLSTWWVRLKPGIILVEFKHLRYGRIVYFFKQISHKSSINVQLIICNMGSVTMRHTTRSNVTLLPFN
jgi:ribosomal protein L16/L10AE